MHASEDLLAVNISRGITNKPARQPVELGDVTQDLFIVSSLQPADHLRANFNTNPFAARAETGYRLVTALMGVAGARSHGGWTHDRAVLARQTVWPERLFSLLAGFVEAGESFETCVGREITEEIGLTVTDVRYLGSQPWPFPRSLMVGFHAIGDPEQEFSFNDGEIAEAAWFTRAEVREALDHGDWSSDSPSRLLLPGSISIAREIIESWAALD